MKVAEGKVDARFSFSIILLEQFLRLLFFFYLILALSRQDSGSSALVRNSKVISSSWRFEKFPAGCAEAKKKKNFFELLFNDRFTLRYGANAPAIILLMCKGKKKNQRKMNKIFAYIYRIKPLKITPPYITTTPRAVKRYNSKYIISRS